MKKTANIALGFKIAIAYRFAFFINLIIAPLTFLIYFFLWHSIYAYSGTTIIRGFTLEEMITYYIMGLIISLFVWSNAEYWLEENILSGDVVLLFQKPISIFSQIYFFGIGINLLTIIIEAIPIYLIGLFFFGVKSATLAHTLFFIISISLASIIYFMFSFIIGLTAFWMKKINGLSRAKEAIISLFSGALLPLTFYPEWFQEISFYLPFQYLRYVPINIFLGRYNFFTIGIMIFVKLIWIGLLFILIRWFEKKAFKKLSGAGI